MKQSGGEMRLAVIGVGKLGGILLEAFLKQGLVSPPNVFATDQQLDKTRKALDHFSIRLDSDNRAAVREADIVLLCVKPHVMGEVLDEIKSELNDRKLVISVAASVPTDFIEQRVGARIPVIRAMPNTPALVGAGMTALAKGKFASDDNVALAKKLFDAVGATVISDEEQMDAITGLSGSGPAYIYMVIESLADGGVAAGLPRELATQLAAQTALGGAKMVLETRQSPSALKDQVATPGGCTVEGLRALDEGALRATLMKAVEKAAARATELLFKSESK